MTIGIPIYFMNTRFQIHGEKWWEIRWHQTKFVLWSIFFPNLFISSRLSFWKSAQQIFVLIKTFFCLRLCLQDVLIKTNIFALPIGLQKMSSRLLQDILVKTNIFVLVIHPQDVLIKTNIFALVIGPQKTFSRRVQDVLVKTIIFVLVIRLRDVFKTFSRLFQDFFKMSCQDVLKTSSKRLAKTSSRCLQDVLKTSLRFLQDIFKASCKDVFKTFSRRTYYQVKLVLLTPLRGVFSRFLRRTANMVIYRRICLSHTLEKFMASEQSLQEWQRFLKF